MSVPHVINLQTTVQGTWVDFGVKPSMKKILTKILSTKVLSDITFTLYLASYYTQNTTQPWPDDQSSLRLEQDAQLKTHDRTHPTSSLDDTPTRMTMSGLMVVV